MFLLRALGLERSEAPLVALLIALSVLLGLPTLFTLTAGMALLLAHYDAEVLPWAFIVMAVVNPVVGVGVLRASQVVPPSRLLRLLLAALAVTMAALWALQRIPLAWPALVLVVWSEVELVMVTVVFADVTERLFTVRQSKRLFGLVSSGEVLAHLVGGLLIGPLVGRLGTAQLLWVSVAGLLGGLVVISALVRRWPDRFAAEEADDDSEDDEPAVGLRSLLRSRMVVLLFLLAGMTTFAFNVMDNVLYLVAEVQYPNADDLATLIGRLSALLAAGSLALKVGVSGRYTGWVGLGGALLTTPATLAALALVLAAAGLFGATLPVEVGIASAMWVMHQVTKEGLHGGPFQTLFGAVPGRLRSQAIASSESIAGQLGGGVAGVALLALLGLGIGARGLSAGLAVLCVAWCALTVIAVREYRRGLAAALQRGLLAEAALDLQDPATLDMVRLALGSERPADIEYAVDLLVRAGHPSRHVALVHLLRHPADRVVVHVAGHLAADPTSTAAEAAFEALDRPRSALVRAALVEAAGACSPETAAARLGAFVDAAEPPVRDAACVALLRHGGLDGAMLAGPRVKALAASEHPGERERAASILGRVGRSDLFPDLLALLDDRDRDVRRTAVAAAGAIAAPTLWPAVVAALGDPAISATAADALVAAGPDALDALGAAADTSTVPLETRCLAMAVAARIGGAEAARMLVARLGATEPGLRTAVLEALEACRYHAPEQPELLAAADRELAFAASKIAARRDLDPIDTPLLEEALDRDLHATLDRAFRCYAAAYEPGVLRAWQQVQVDDADQQALAIELIDGALPRAVGRLLLPWLERRDGAALLAAHPQPALTRLDRLRAIGADEAGSGRWVRTLALHALGGQGLPRLTTDPTAWLDLSGSTVELATRLQGGRVTDSLTLVCERAAQLDATDVFGDLPGEPLALLAARTRQVDAAAGQTVLREGERGAGLYVVIAGRVRVHVGDTVLAEQGPGSVFGELAAIDPWPRSASVTAIEPTSLLRLASDDLRDVALRQMALADGLRVLLCRRIRDRVTSVASTQRLPTGYLTAPLAALHANPPDDDLTELEKLLVLRSSPGLAHVAEPALVAIARVARTVELPAGQSLFRRGSLGRTTFVVVSGAVVVRQGTQVFAELPARSVIGELSAFDPEPREATVTAREHTRLLAVSHRALLAVVHASPATAWVMLQILVRRLRAVTTEAA